MESQIVNIKKQTASALEVQAGRRIKIVIDEGPQIAVLVAFNKKNLKEFFSPGNTRLALAFGPDPRPDAKGLMPYWVEKGDVLVSNKWNKVLTLLEDTYGKHDIVFDPCDTILNGDILGLGKGYPGCRELHTEALKLWGIGYEDVPAGVNLFQNTIYSEEGIQTLPTNAQKGDTVIFETHMDLLVSVSACPCPLNESKSVKMEIM